MIPASGRECVEFKARPNTLNALLGFQPAAELLNYSESFLLSINTRPGSEPGNPGAPAPCGGRAGTGTSEHNRDYDTSTSPLHPLFIIP